MSADLYGRGERPIRARVPNFKLCTVHFSDIRITDIRIILFSEAGAAFPGTKARRYKTKGDCVYGNIGKQKKLAGRIINFARAIEFPDEAKSLYGKHVFGGRFEKGSSEREIFLLLGYDNNNKGSWGRKKNML